MPEGSNYNLTLYDEYGNQVGKAEWDVDGRKTLNIPNWDTATNEYCIKIENEFGEEISAEDYYKISFHISETVMLDEIENQTIRQSENRLKS